MGLMAKTCDAHNCIQAPRTTASLMHPLMTEVPGVIASDSAAISMGG